MSNLNVLQVVSTTPAIDFRVTAATVAANGHQLLLVGSSHAVSVSLQQEPLLLLLPAAPAAAGIMGPGVLQH